MTDSRHIVVFDGVCNFCNAAVNFIITRDPTRLYVFVPIQSRTGQRLLDEHSVAELRSNSFVLLKNNKCYIRTDAALEIAKDLKGYWFLFGVFRVLPRGFRDYIYNLLASNRYRLFGRRDTCMIPSEDVRSRFIED